MSVGIYEIRCIENGKNYIGKSTNLDEEWINLRMKLYNDNHPNNNLQIDWNVYGAHKFQFNIVRECSYELLDTYYKYYIDVLNAVESGYNLENENILEEDRIEIEFNKHDLRLAYNIHKIINNYSNMDKMSDTIKADMREREGALMYLDEIRTSVLSKLDTRIVDKIGIYGATIDIDACRHYIVDNSYIEVNIHYNNVSRHKVKVYINDEKETDYLKMCGDVFTY